MQFRVRFHKIGHSFRYTSVLPGKQCSNSARMMYDRYQQDVRSPLPELKSLKLSKNLSTIWSTTVNREISTRDKMSVLSDNWLVDEFWFSWPAELSGHQFSGSLNESYQIELLQIQYRQDIFPEKRARVHKPYYEERAGIDLPENLCKRFDPKTDGFFNSFIISSIAPRPQ